MEDDVILVNEADEVLGIGGKMRVHRDGVLHRAFSIFLFNSAGELLIQKRAETKYHSPSLWSNTCCGHPRPDESIEQAAHRRLREELGFDGPLIRTFSFVYKAVFANNLVEHEYDHVLVGTTECRPVPNASEVADWMWVDPITLKSSLDRYPGEYTAWLKPSLDGVLKVIEDHRRQNNRS
jgi:isopentenyl-diphosphate delta-isomerase